MRQEPEQEFFRLHLEAPPPSSPIEGARPPFCPFMQAAVPMIGNQKIIEVGGRQQGAVEVQVNSVGLPCMRQNCLFWDRLDRRCAFTSLLDMMLCGGDNDETTEAPPAPAPPAPAPLPDSSGG